MGRVRDWWGSRHATRIRACRGLVNLHQERRVGRKRRLSLWSTGRKDHAPSGETKFKLEMAQSITDAISTGGNGGMWWNNSVFCNELINYAVRIFRLFSIIWSRSLPCEILCVTHDKVPVLLPKNIKQIGLLISRAVETCLNFLSWSYFSSLP